MTFDLLDEAWLPVRDHHGSIREVSLVELFADAPRWQDLAIAFVPEQVAVTRILVAALQSALRGPSGRRQRCEWMENHSDCAERVVEYLHRHRERFDLFHHERPFMQQLVDEEMAADRTVASIVLEWTSGNNVTLFDHHFDSRRSGLSPAHAARALLTTLLFQPGGGVSKPFNRTDSPGSKGLMVLVKGADLWQTLVGNTPTLGPAQEDAPIWERDVDHTPIQTGTTPLGWLDRATWRSRAIQLIRDDDGLVRHCRVHQHLKLRDDPPNDPFIPVRQKTGEEPKIVRLPADRRLWRAADVILRGLASDERPTIVAQAVATFERCDLPHPQMLVAGLRVDQGKVGDAQSAVLPVTRSLLEDDQRLDFIGSRLEDAQRGADAIRAGIAAYRTGLGAARDARAVARWQEPYWASLATPFAQMMQCVATAEEVPLNAGSLAIEWLEVVRTCARSAMDALATLDAASPRHARALAEAHRAFRRKLRSVSQLSPEVA